MPTLERWYRLYKKGGLAALRPEPRADKGAARALTAEQQELVCEVRREYPSASAELILDTLVLEGRIDQEAISSSAVRRLLAARGLDRRTLRTGGDGKQRLRREAERPGALWHGDVCHAAPILIDSDNKKPVRVHALLDDASRFVLAIEAMHQEREIDMLGLLVRAIRKHGPPDAIYLDNGATYRGHTLALACARMGTTLVHAKPYDAPARGKMERFWRTLRERCLDFTGALASLHDVNVRLYAFLDEHYHRSPHAGLMGKTPEAVFAAAPRHPDGFDEAKLRDALTVHVRRRVRGDCTVPMVGEDWETDLGFLARKLVTVSRCMVDAKDPPWLEHEGARHVLRLVDPRHDARRSRSPVCRDVPHEARIAFDPPATLLAPRQGPRSQEGGAMTLDYLEHFALSGHPFSKDIGDTELWMPPSKQSLVEDLTDAMHARASVLLTGEPGVGKACVLRALRHALAPANFRLVYCQNTTVGRRDFYRHLCLALGLPKAATAGDLFLTVSTHVEQLATERVSPVFLVDEAHLLHQDTLDHLHILLNYQWDSKPLLSLVLIGLSELDDRLRLRRNRSLYSRIHHRFTFGALAPDDTGDYVRTRLARVGATKDIFSVDAVALLHEAAGSSLRDTDRIAGAALRLAARRKKKLVERDVLTRILQAESEDRS